MKNKSFFSQHRRKLMAHTQPIATGPDVCHPDDVKFFTEQIRQVPTRYHHDLRKQYQEWYELAYYSCKDLNRAVGYARKSANTQLRAIVEKLNERYPHEDVVTKHYQTAPAKTRPGEKS